MAASDNVDAEVRILEQRHPKQRGPIHLQNNDVSLDALPQDSPVEPANLDPNSIRQFGEFGSVVDEAERGDCPRLK